MATNSKKTDYRPGTLGWYLTQAGWSPVQLGKQHWLWEKDGQTLAAYDAWTIELRRIWKETRKAKPSMNSEVKYKPLPEIESLAARRHGLHTGQASHRPLSDEYELVGLAGEFAFAELFGLDVDLQDRPDGDKGVDFIVNGLTIDVKTARKAFNLLVEKTKAHQVADVLVLASFSDETRAASLVGWEYSKGIQGWAVKEFVPGVVNYAKPARELRPIDELIELLKEAA